MTIVITESVVVPFDAAVAETTVINAGVSIAAAGPYALRMFGNDMIVRNRGTIDGPDRMGVLMWANQSTFANDATGTVDGGYAAVAATVMNGWISNAGTMTGTFAGIDLDGASDTKITNNGDISGTAYGIRSEGLGTHIENSGTISGDFGIFLTETAFVLNAASGIVGGDTAAVVMNNDWGRATVVNKGTLNGLVAFDDAADNLNNSGTLNGDVRMGGGTDVVSNSGSIGGQISLGDGNDNYKGGAATAAAAVTGEAGKDKLAGGAFADDLNGGADRDTVNGGGGADRLVGGGDRDIISGGADADTFVYVETSDSSSFDIIMDFESGVDVIDLTELAHGRLTYLGTSEFAGGGQAAVRYEATNFGHAFVRVDNDGDGAQDMSILLRDVRAMDAGDFLL